MLWCNRPTECGDNELLDYLQGFNVRLEGGVGRGVGGVKATRLPDFGSLVKIAHHAGHTLDSINDRFGLMDGTWRAGLSLLKRAGFSRARPACLALPSMKACAIMATAGLDSL